MTATSVPVVLFLIACTAPVIARLSAIERRLARLTQLDAKLDALLKHAGVAFDPYDQVPPQVADAVRRGEKIEAIKLYREATGTGLKDAKEIVEAIQRRGGHDV